MYDFRSLAKHCGITINILCIHKLVLVWIQTPHTHTHGARECAEMRYRFVSSDRCHTYTVHSIFMIHWNWIQNPQCAVAECRRMIRDTRYIGAMVSISDNIRIVCKMSENQIKKMGKRESDDDSPWALASLHIFLQPHWRRRHQIRSVANDKRDLLRSRYA